jgi:predicted glycoside hydrolase/deacetylase ChbG (UPF0249 family)
MVDAIAAAEAGELTKLPDLSIGLHFEVKEIVNVVTELERQVEKFTTIVGRTPDHIDTHKRHTTDDGIKRVLEDYAKNHDIPIRNFNAKHIGSFGINSDDCSVAQLKRSIDEATEEYNELMTHVGYSDDYLREHSSYSDLREDELKAICSPEAKQYIQGKGLKLISWRDLTHQDL